MSNIDESRFLGLPEHFWFGTYLQLAMEFKTGMSEVEINLVKSIIVSQVNLIRGDEDRAVVRLPWKVFDLDKEIAFMIDTVKEKYDHKKTWVVIYIPFGSIEETFSPNDLFDLEISYTIKLTNWLASIGSHVYNAIQFDLGLIGEEISGTVYGREILERDRIDPYGIGMLVPRGRDKVIYYPPRLIIGDEEEEDETED